jgi:CRP-like cAMP-binding protein
MKSIPMLLNGLPDQVKRSATIRELEKNEWLFRKGDPASAIFEVVSGRVRLVRQTIDDHLEALHTARDGDHLAEAALFSDLYHCDALARVPARVRVYTKEILLSAFRAAPLLYEDFAARLARQLQAVRMRLELRNIRSARARLLQYLRLSASRDGRSVPLAGQLQDLAPDVGLTREALYRTLALLETEGLIVRNPGGFTLKKPSGV